jgi:NAD-dependent dihydropyrimidine dehydrogenase PreA subunit
LKKEAQMKIRRKIIEIDKDRCNGCGQCVDACAEGAIALVDGKATLVSETYCDGLAACVGDCPRDALKIVERDADAFDPEAVEQCLKRGVTAASAAPHGVEDSKLETRNSTLGGATLPCGCPSTHLQMFSSPCQAANEPVTHETAESALTHWPVQIRLVPAAAPFLQKANLLVAADCTPVAYPDLHRDFLKGRTVLIGCPKFDDTEGYIEKFRDIFRANDIQSVTMLVMEVPCCSKLPKIVQAGMELAGKRVPFEVAVVGTRGKIVSRVWLAA